MEKTSGLFTRVKEFLFGGYIPPLTDSGIDSISAAELKTKTDQMRSNVGWVFAANELIAEDCASVKLRLMQVSKKPGAEDKEIYAHEVLDLLDNPNNAITAKQMWSLYYQYLNLTGEAYFLKIGKDGEIVDQPDTLPAALLPVPSHLCELKVNSSSWTASTIMFNGKAYPLTAFLRDINPDPANPYRGVSIIEKSALSIDTDEQMKKWNNKIFRNNARPGVVISVPDKIDDKSLKRLKQQFDEQYRGSENAFKRIILENGTTIKPFMMSQQDLDFLSSRAFTRDEILGMFKVSKSNLGITDDVNRANGEAQEYSYTKRCVKPRLEQFVDFMNRRLIFPVYGKSVYLTFENPVPADKKQQLAENNSGINKWLTIDEVRSQYGYSPLPNGLGAQLYVPMNTMPLNEAATPFSPPEEKPEEKPTEDTEEKKNIKAEPTQKTKDLNPEKLDPRDIIGEAKVKEYTIKSGVYEKMVLRVARKMFDSQTEDIKAWLDTYLKNSYKKSDLRKKDWASDMVDWEKYKLTFQAEMEKIYRIIIEEIGAEAFSALTEGEFDPYRLPIEEIIKGSAERASLEVNNETEKQIRATLAEGLRDNEDITQLSSRVLDVMGTASTTRANLIAQTESAAMMNYADTVAWGQTGVVAAKEWFTAEDERVCGFCNEMNGVAIGLDQNFFNKGDVQTYTDGKGKTHSMKLDYRDIVAPPSHPRCRCVLLPIMV